MENLLRAILVLHITGGFTALVTGVIAMLTRKGGPNHRLSGKIYFGGMTAVFISAIILSIAHHIPFLLMVGFFSYYMVVRGYRALYLKKLGMGQKAGFADWLILLIAGGFIIYLLGWGIVVGISGNGFGVVAIVFGILGCSFLQADLSKLIRGPKEKMHWWGEGVGEDWQVPQTVYLKSPYFCGPWSKISDCEKPT